MIKKRKRPMRKLAVSLMCNRIKKLKVDVDELAYNEPEKCIRFIHDQYEEAESNLNQENESQS